MVDRLTAAFGQGDPMLAWEASRELIALGRKLLREAGVARFGANFGGPRCQHCDGLKAGPDVAATCFQLKECHYSSLKIKPTPRQGQIIDSLTQHPNPERL